MYKGKDALWFHDGNKLRPHALLTSGKHSSGFFNSRIIIADEKLLKEAAADLIANFLDTFSLAEELDNLHVSCIVGPQTGATRLAELLSIEILPFIENDCLWASPRKDDTLGKKSMIFSDAELGFMKGQSVLLCEDVVTTGGSIDLTVEAITKAGGTVLPFVLALVNRSGESEVSGKKIIALINRRMPMWEPVDCPLCKHDSKAVRPKENWAKLTAEYN